MTEKYIRKTKELGVFVNKYDFIFYTCNSLKEGPIIMKLFSDPVSVIVTDNYAFNLYKEKGEVIMSTCLVEPKNNIVIIDELDFVIKYCSNMELLQKIIDGAKKLVIINEEYKNVGRKGIVIHNDKMIGKIKMEKVTRENIERELKLKTTTGENYMICFDRGNEMDKMWNLIGSKHGIKTLSCLYPTNLENYKHKFILLQENKGFSYKFKKNEILYLFMTNGVLSAS